MIKRMCLLLWWAVGCFGFSPHRPSYRSLCKHQPQIDARLPMRKKAAGASPKRAHQHHENENQTEPDLNKLGHEFAVAKDWIWRVATIACTAFVLFGAIPLVGSAMFISTASSLAVVTAGLVLAGIESGASEIFALATFGAAVVLFYTFFGGSLIIYPSLVILGLGLSLLLIGFSQLGEDALVLGVTGVSRLHTSGVYKIVRHPMYSGLILSSFGLAGLTDSPERAVASLFLYPILREQIKVEERLLQEQHGAVYSDYSSEVKGVIFPASPLAVPHHFGRMIKEHEKKRREEQRQP
mmetsp:Transcript_58134/g.131733  ORF Transcript_58134/g.131733 Transcript_58134/m.131733 type:complete len:296 (+) Transcript_58134:266-1153(+)